MIDHLVLPEMELREWFCKSEEDRHPVWDT
jgi:hypothetical protein